MADPDVQTDPGRPGGTAAQRAPRRRASVGWVVVLVVGLLVYLTVLLLYARSGRNEGPEVAEPPPTGVEVSIDLTDLNAGADRLLADVTIVPGSALETPEGILEKDIDLVIAPVAGEQELRFARGHFPGTVPIQFILDGDIESWPFDHYTGIIVIQASSGTGAASESVPLVVSVGGHVKGWRTTVERTIDPQDPDSAMTGFQVLDVHASRSGGTLSFALIMILVLITMPVLALFVSYEVMRGRRKAEPAFAGWIAAMLFATIPLRNFLPGSPPAGSWIDVAVVLWVIVGLVFSLVLYVLSWWRRGVPPAPPDP